MKYIAPKYGIGDRVRATVPVFPVGVVKGVRTRGDDVSYLVVFDGPAPQYREWIREEYIEPVLKERKEVKA